LFYELGKTLEEISGMDEMSLQPGAGAQGELTSIMVIKAFHEANGDTDRDKVIIPDSAHGTNPATAAMAGYKTLELKSNENGTVDVEHLKALVGDDTAALMRSEEHTSELQSRF